MKTCDGCKHAEWKYTTTGRLHPGGDGRCTWKYKAPALPQSMFWTGRPNPPEPSGGYINRRHPLPDHCVYFTRG